MTDEERREMARRNDKSLMRGMGVSDDMVRVVRCEHCLYSKDYPRQPEMVHCTHACCPDLLVRRDWFCADGERRDGE